MNSVCVAIKIAIQSTEYFNYKIKVYLLNSKYYRLAVVKLCVLHARDRLEPLVTSLVTKTFLSENM